MRLRKDYDYYIFLDYSEDLIGYNIIEQKKIIELLPKISRFEHYKGRKNRKIYLKHIIKTIKREKKANPIKCQSKIPMKAFFRIRLTFTKGIKAIRTSASTPGRMLASAGKMTRMMIGYT